MRDCDFIPGDYRERQSMRRSARRRVSMVVTLVAMMGVWMAAHQRQLASAQAMLSDLSRQDEQMRIHLANKAALEMERTRLEERANLVLQLSSRTQLAVVLSDLSRRLADTLVVTEITVHSAGLARFATPPVVSPAATPPRSRSPQFAESVPTTPVARPTPTLAVTGIARSAQDVIHFAAALEGSPLFDRVQIQSQGPASWAGRRGEKFEIDCDLAEQVGDVR